LFVICIFLYISSSQDNDHAGAFGFTHAKYEVVESDGRIDVPVKRTRGARGRVSVPYHTVEGTAKAGADYEHVEGVLDFADEVQE
jgi:solute carrier family 8 (sodium/calcium exchanger)